MKSIRIYTTTFLCLLFSGLSAQQINYQVLEKNVDKFRGYVMPDASVHLGGGTGAGLNIGAVSQYRLPSTPVTLRGNFRWEFLGAGKSALGKTIVLDAGAMFPIIPGRKKTERVKITTNYSESSRYISEEYFMVDGEVKKDLLLRGGAYQIFSTTGLSTTGLSAGLAFRVLEHAQVKVADYTYEANYNWQIYVDAMYAPVSNMEDFSNEVIPYGGKVGLLSTGQNWDWYGEVCLYPKGPFYLIFGFLFDLGWDLK